MQGLDYAYTLQGWLKGINSTGGTETVDMGEDGNTGSQNQFTARDALGLTLNYFGNDYSAINGTPFPAYSGYMPTGAFKPLYNGNISSSSVYQKKFDYSNSPGGPLIFYNYQYDQLNRLTGQDAYNGFNSSTNSWSGGVKLMSDQLKERIAYDANGNIKKYLRNSIDGTNPQMDSLNYYYYPGTNQLKRITDSLSATAYMNPDIQDIDGQPDSNYVYDAIGNLTSDKKENITSIKWNVYGKIQEIDRIATTDVPASNIKYTYDALGNRISQIVTSGGTKYYTWYVRDAQGNILTTYTAEGPYAHLDSLDLKLGQRFLYGSSRLGLITVDDDNVDGGPGSTEYLYQYRDFAYDRGHKQYELTNHLGNVLATVSDRKFGVSSGSSSLIDHYEPHIVTAQDYYPFGMLSRVSLPSNNVSYKFGFNGKLNDNEVKGLGNQQDYGMRIYDPRVGRFLSVDPLTKQYPQLTPYQYASNSPIAGIDLDGLEHIWYFIIWDKKGQTAVQLEKAEEKWNPFTKDYNVRSWDRAYEMTYKSFDEMKKDIIGKTKAEITKMSDETFEAVTRQAALTTSSMESHNESVFASAQADVSFSNTANYAADEVGITVNPGLFVSRKPFLASLKSIGKMPENVQRRIMYHYTSEEGLKGIMSSKVIYPSLKANNPKDARYGDGQYFSDIVPGSMTPAELSRAFVRVPFQGKKYSYYIAIDVTGLRVVKAPGREGVFVILNSNNLNVQNRIVGSGPVQTATTSAGTGTNGNTTGH